MESRDATSLTDSRRCLADRRHSKLPAIMVLSAPRGEPAFLAIRRRRVTRISLTRSQTSLQEHCLRAKGVSDFRRVMATMKATISEQHKAGLSRGYTSAVRCRCTFRDRNRSFAVAIVHPCRAANVPVGIKHQAVQITPSESNHVRQCQCNLKGT